MQKLSNINEFDYGVLFDDMVFVEGSEIFVGCFIVLCVEVEFVFLFDKDLSGLYCMVFDVFGVMVYVFLVIEIIDVWIQQFDLEMKVICKVFDIIFDNVVNVGIVIGGCLVWFFDFDLCWLGVLFYKNGVIEEIGVVVGVLNYLVNGVVWLVNKYVVYG